VVTTVVKIRDDITAHNKAVRQRAMDPRVGAMLLHDIDVSVDFNFLVEGRDKQGNTGVWPPRKRPIRVKRKGRTVRSKKQGRLLYRTGALFKSTKAIHDYRYEDGTWIMTKGSNLPYAGPHNLGAIIHHPGTDNGWGRGIYIPPHDIEIPQREYLMVPDPELDAMGKKAARYIMGK
jgi:phage gpG-like protein